MPSFHYFDQYKDTSIDLSSYLNSVSTSNNFNYTFTNIQSVKVSLKNIFDKIAIVKQFEQDILNFEFWKIGENDRPESIAHQIYGDKNLWWTVLLFNGITNVYTQWPLSENLINLQADQLFAQNGMMTRQTYYNLIHEENEKKRVVKLIKPILIESVVAKFRQEFEKSGV